MGAVKLRLGFDFLTKIGKSPESLLALWTVEGIVS